MTDYESKRQFEADVNATAKAGVVFLAAGVAGAAAASTSVEELALLLFGPVATGFYWYHRRRQR